MLPKSRTKSSSEDAIAKIGIDLQWMEILAAANLMIGQKGSAATTFSKIVPGKGPSSFELRNQKIVFGFYIIKWRRQ